MSSGDVTDHQPQQADSLFCLIERKSSAVVMCVETPGKGASQGGTWVAPCPYPLGSGVVLQVMEWVVCFGQQI